MVETAFITGFPGFLDSRLIPRLLQRDPERRATCLVQPRYAHLASTRTQAVVAADPLSTGASSSPRATSPSPSSRTRSRWRERPPSCGTWLPPRTWVCAVARR